MQAMKPRPPSIRATYIGEPKRTIEYERPDRLPVAPHEPAAPERTPEHVPAEPREPVKEPVKVP